MTAIRTKNITKKFGEKMVLRDVNLEIGQGEIFGLLGPSGAGKTTFIKILTGQLDADYGASAINGKNSAELEGEDYKDFGIMMDNFGVYERLNCIDNLKLFADIYGISNDRITKSLEDVQLSGAAKTAAGSLSKGQQSRLRLARVFMTDPSVIFLDEPTSGLDPVTAEEIQQMILREKENGKTVFLTTHIMAEAEKLCDNVALLNEGDIVEYGNPKDICRRYNHQRNIQIHMKNGEDRQIPQDENAAETLCDILKSGLCDTIHTSEPNLETVFMELTGKELSK